MTTNDLFGTLYLASNLLRNRFNLTRPIVQSWTSFSGQDIVFGTVDIFVISQPKWLKFGVQAHLFKMIGHTNFQLSISCTFKVMKLLVEVKVEQNFDKNWKNSNFLQINDVI